VVYFDHDRYDDFSPSWKAVISAHEWGHNLNLADHSSENQCDVELIMATENDPSKPPCLLGPSWAEAVSVADFYAYGSPADPNGDGVPDWRDNCPPIANPGQEDADGDGIGNVCELDVDCDGDLDAVDALFILQHAVGLRPLYPYYECPPPPGHLSGPRASAYVAYPGGGTVLDTLMALRCVLGYHNIVCPAGGGGSAPPAAVSPASGQGGGPTVSIEGGQAPTGGTDVTTLSALGVSDPALCGFAVDVQYDPLVTVPMGCDPDPEGKFDAELCNPNYPGDIVRVVGATGSLEGVRGDIPLADITWCAVGSLGESTDLDVRIVSFLDCADAPAEITPVAEQDGVNVIVTGPPAVGTDSDGDGFGDCVEAYLATDPYDNCPDVVGSDDAWPLDIDMSRDISVTGDVLNYVGRIGATPASPNWWQRLDLDTSGDISVTGDLIMYNGRIGQTCT